jgi:hypothetical protein
MVDPRAKGATAETKARDELRKVTKLKWERVPGSGALDEKHGLKGDLYIPNEKNLYCVEVKHYADDHFNTSLFTGKQPQLIDFWQQTIRESGQVNKQPLLIFKHDRSKFFAAYKDMPTANYRYAFISVLGHEFYVATLEDYLNHEKPKFIA